jgi:hypothetical protein
MICTVFSAVAASSAGASLIDEASRGTLAELTERDDMREAMVTAHALGVDYGENNGWRTQSGRAQAEFALIAMVVWCWAVAMAVVKHTYTRRTHASSRGIRETA